MRSTGIPVGLTQAPGWFDSGFRLNLARSIATSISGSSDLALDVRNRELHEALAQALGTARTARVLGNATKHDTPERRAAKLIGPC
jgi:hypothetical protein